MDVGSNRSGPLDIDLTCSGCTHVDAPTAPAGVVLGLSGCARWLANGTGALNTRPLLDTPPIIGAT